MLDRRLLLLYYEENPSYAAVGRRLGVSRQRIEQIIRKMPKKDLVGIYNLRRIPYATVPCRLCFKYFTKRGAMIGDLCKLCDSWVRKGSRKPGMRKHLRPTSCRICEHPFTKELPNGGLGLCIIDYRKELYKRYSQSEEYRQRRREYSRKSALIHKDTIKAYQKKYYAEHRDVVDANVRIWRKNNPEKTRIYQKKAYWRKKQEALNI